jgi:hypothetical protein
VAGSGGTACKRGEDAVDAAPADRGNIVGAASLISAALMTVTSSDSRVRNCVPNVSSNVENCKTPYCGKSPEEVRDTLEHMFVFLS